MTDTEHENGTESDGRAYRFLAVIHFFVFGGGLAWKAVRAGEPLWVATISGLVAGGVFFGVLWKLGNEKRDLVGGVDG